MTREMRRFAATVGATAVTLLCTAVPSSWATVTIGSDFSPPASGSTLCGCTMAQAALPGALVASPVNGTVVRWRIKAHPAGPGPFNLRVLRPLGTAALFLGTSAPESAPGGAIKESGTSLPISIGDLIGVDSPGGAAIEFVDAPGASRQVWGTIPANGATASPISSQEVENFLNADIEPTSTVTVAKPKADKKGTATLTVTVPNPGALAVTGRLVKSATAAPTAPGLVELKLRPTPKTRARLREKGKARGRVQVSFTPSFGQASSQSVRLKLRLPPR